MRTARLALVLLLGLAAPASAVTLQTPILYATSANYALACFVSNVGTTPVTVTVSLTDFGNSTVAPTLDTCALLGGVLPPGESCYAAKSSPITVRCSVDASSSKIRAELMLENANGDPTVSVPATKK